MTPEEFGLARARQLEAKILELGAENVAAFIGEPFQGAGGVIFPPSTYWPEIQRICRKYDVLLVADEVIGGFGRTGEWFAHQHFGFEPDLITLAKGLTSGYVPMGAVGLHDRVAKAIIENGEFNHGLTYSGHPVAAAVAVANLKLLRDEKIVERVKHDTGPYFQKRLRETFADHPIVGEISGAGLVAGIQLAEDPRTQASASPMAAKSARCAATSASTATSSCAPPATACCCRRRSSSRMRKSTRSSRRPRPRSMQPRGRCLPASGRSASDALLDHVEKALAQRFSLGAIEPLQRPFDQQQREPMHRRPREIFRIGPTRRRRALPPRPSGRGPRSATGTGRARCARRSYGSCDAPTPPWARQTPCEKAPFAFARNADNPCRPRAGSRAPRPRAGAFSRHVGKLVFHRHGHRR